MFVVLRIIFYLDVLILTIKPRSPRIAASLKKLKLVDNEANLGPRCLAMVNPLFLTTVVSVSLISAAGVP